MIIKNSITTWPAVALACVISACSSSDSLHSQNAVLPTQKITPPIQLRNIAVEDLSAQISIAGTTTTYSARDFPDGQWLVNINAPAEQSYDITIAWYSGPYLILEETGSLYADPNAVTVVSDLDFVTAGFPRFDIDCDDISNLNEVLNGSDPSIATGSQVSACNEVANAPPIELQEFESPWIVKQHEIFENVLMEEPFNSFEQTIQVQSTSPNLIAVFGAAIFDDNEVAADRIRANIELVSNPDMGRQARFRFTSAASHVSPPIEGASCKPFGADDSGIICGVPFDWQEQKWYDIRMSRLSDTVWQASVRDRASGIRQVIASVDAGKSITWQRSQTSMFYQDSIPAEECRLGVEPVELHFTSGEVNGGVVLNSSQLVRSRCVTAGAGWQEGVRTVDDELIYSMTLGTSN